SRRCGRHRLLGVGPGGRHGHLVGRVSDVRVGDHHDAELTMGTVKLDELLTRRLPTRDVEGPGGGTIRVRGLSRAEMQEVNQQVWSSDELVTARKLPARA